MKEIRELLKMWKSQINNLNHFLFICLWNMLGIIKKEILSMVNFVDLLEAKWMWISVVSFECFLSLFVSIRTL